MDVRSSHYYCQISVHNPSKRPRSSSGMVSNPGTANNELLQFLDSKGLGKNRKPNLSTDRGAGLHLSRFGISIDSYWGCFAAREELFKAQPRKLFSCSVLVEARA